MSTDYSLGKPILVSELRRLEKYGVTFEEITAKDQEEIILQKDGSYLHADLAMYTWDDGQKRINNLTRYGANDEEKIIAAIEEEFRVVVVSEEEDDYMSGVDYAQWKRFPEGPCPCCGKEK